MTNPSPPAQDDPFTPLLNLEQTFYTEGHTLGVTDGARAGKIEGRTFGLEQGLAKFAELGRLGGRAAVWNARLNNPVGQAGSGEPREGVEIRASERTKRNIARIAELADPESLEMQNSEEGVGECEERVREGRAKAVLVSRAVGEREGGSAGGEEGGEGGKRGLRVKDVGGGEKSGREMEDFAGVLPAGAKKG